LSLVFVAWFYRLLPAEVGYLFGDGGEAEARAGRGGIALWAVIPQLVLTLAAWGLTLGIGRLARMSGQTEKSAVSSDAALVFIGNMIAIPQIILCFAMLDIFSYNSYQVHLLPLWLLALIVLVGGGIILSIFFIRALLRVWRSVKE
jgi:hypothetical protein